MTDETTNVEEMEMTGNEENKEVAAEEEMDANEENETNEDEQTDAE